MGVQFDVAGVVAGHSPADQQPIDKTCKAPVCDVWPPSSDCLVVYDQFVTLKNWLPATSNNFLRSRQENINN